MFGHSVSKFGHRYGLDQFLQKKCLLTQNLWVIKLSFKSNIRHLLSFTHEGVINLGV